MAVHSGMYNMAREEGKQEALAGLKQSQQVQGAMQQAGQQGYNQGHNEGVSVGANEAAAQIVAGLNAPQQGGQPTMQEAQPAQEFAAEEIQEVAGAVVSGEIDEEDLDQMEAQYPGVKGAVLSFLQNQEGAPTESPVPVEPTNGQAGLNLA